MLAPADMVFAQGPHAAFPQIPNQGGPRMAHPQIVPITFADDPNRATIESFSKWIVGSTWMTTVGADYGFGSATVLGNVERTENAPDAVSLDGIESFISAGIADKSIPEPAGGDLSSVFYMVYYPVHTTITAVDQSTGESSTSCVDFLAWHDYSQHATTPFAFTFIPTCVGGTPGLTDLESVESSASHELAEASSDPSWFKNPAFIIPKASTTPWVLTGGENGDMCSWEPAQWREGGFVAQRIWSNSAALTTPSGDPCVPAIANDVYYNVSTTPDTFWMSAPGQVVNYTIQGWSTAPMKPWTLEVDSPDLPASSLHLSSKIMTNGGTAQLTVTIPATAKKGTNAMIEVFSSRSATDYHVWFAGIRIQ